MKLFYYKDPIGNFGDDLNPWIWDKLLPDFFDEDESEWLVGIGTLLNHKLPSNGKKLILGSGYGYGEPPSIDSSYHFFSVRGPKTAQVLGIDSNLAITDPAILIRDVYQPDTGKPTTKFGFIPHYDSVINYSWDVLCQQLGIKFINVQSPIDKVLAQMCDCEIIICEAMHGAIVADALRIPWVPVRCYNSVDSFKWEDWLQTLELPYHPQSITPLYDAESRSSIGGRAKSKFKRALGKIGLLSSEWDPPWPAPSKPREIEKAIKDLQSSMGARQFLSNDRLCEDLTDRYLTLMEKVRKIR